MAAAVEVPHVVHPLRPLHIVLGGDVIPHRPQLESPAAVATSLASLSPLFESADAVVVNYETATGDEDALARRPSQRMSLWASPAWGRALVEAHVTALGLANNHACDLGVKGLSASIAAAGDLGVPSLGASADDPWKAQTLATRGDRRVCVVAWTTFLNLDHGSCAASPRLAVAKPDKGGRLRVARAIADAFHDGCSAVIAIAHGGDEYAPQTDAMMAMARAAAEAGADAVVLHHPHVVSPLVAYQAEDGRRVPIFASLGNLVSNQGESWTPAYPPTQHDRHIVYLNGWTRVGMLADLEIGSSAGERLAFGYHLVFVETDHLLDKSNPHPRIAARLVDPHADAHLIASLSRDAEGPRAIFEDPCWIERGGVPAPSCR